LINPLAQLTIYEQRLLEAAQLPPGQLYGYGFSHLVLLAKAHYS
jgi:hypothetical protein